MVVRFTAASCVGSRDYSPGPGLADPMIENTFRIGMLIATAMSAAYWLGDPASRGHYLIAVAAGLIGFSLMFGDFGTGKLMAMLGVMAVCIWVMAVEFGVV